MFSNNLSAKQLAAHDDPVSEYEKYSYLCGDKFSVLYKDGSERTFKHIYGGIEELLSMLNLEEVEDIYDI